mmetsp:Transcript_23777/g.52328  ORF Transcript_23777/g.52328 Transcript_23777/m.52328 type:complete len:670 (+) Transcript_23777:35-2044(+)|eukprot:CAMPEP_0204311524 /NCGR_PEP_ID=MMETSP0469-20131031/2394_1 /ASSEMBLY_ACC=CAM_ASM_000384 /TAXON_ID=2969 /ORGANISM="Oxyrrhis marina" /LENGTH=669 /DNA_ID=CAMNT_0051291487 /DNA_START=25 /DNA_END=2034 /DNA_ORIENTATION=-
MAKFARVVQAQDISVEDEDVAMFAEFLGIDVGNHRLLWFVEDNLAAPLPPFWWRFEDECGRLFYWHELSLTSSWEHPLDQQIQDLALWLIRSDQLADGGLHRSNGMNEVVDVLASSLAELHRECDDLCTMWVGPHSARVADDTSAPYWYNTAVQKSTWEDPLRAINHLIFVTQRCIDFAAEGHRRPDAENSLRLADAVPRAEIFSTPVGTPRFREAGRDGPTQPVFPVAPVAVHFPQSDEDSGFHTPRGMTPVSTPVTSPQRARRSSEVFLTPCATPTGSRFSTPLRGRVEHSELDDRREPSFGPPVARHASQFGSSPAASGQRGIVVTSPGKVAKDVISEPPRLCVQPPVKSSGYHREAFQRMPSSSACAVTSPVASRVAQVSVPSLLERAAQAGKPRESRSQLQLELELSERVQPPQQAERLDHQQLMQPEQPSQRRANESQERQANESQERRANESQEQQPPQPMKRQPSQCEALEPPKQPRHHAESCDTPGAREEIGDEETSPRAGAENLGTPSRVAAEASAQDAGVASSWLSPSPRVPTRNSGNRSRSADSSLSLQRDRGASVQSCTSAARSKMPAVPMVTVTGASTLDLQRAMQDAALEVFLRAQEESVEAESEEPKGFFIGTPGGSSVCSASGSPATPRTGLCGGVALGEDRPDCPTAVPGG